MCLTDGKFQFKNKIFLSLERGCKNNEPSWTVLKLNHKLNLDEMTDYKKVSELGHKIQGGVAFFLMLCETLFAVHKCVSQGKMGVFFLEDNFETVLLLSSGCSKAVQPQP